MNKKTKKNVMIAIAVCLALVFAACIGALIYCGIMTSYTAYTDDGTFDAVPAAYKSKAEQQGRIVSIRYDTSTYYQETAWPNHHDEAVDFTQYQDREDEMLDKIIYVYLPYGYDDSGDTRYNVLYHLHGTTCDGTTLIKGEGKDSETKNLLDNMIQNGDIEPMIVVFPTWYNGLDIDEDNPDYLISHFGPELERDIMPAVEKAFRTYARLNDSMTDEEIGQALESTREHRAVSGYSRGSTLTWNLFANMQQYFKWYIPMSGDYLCEFFNATEESCLEKTQSLCDMLDAGGYGTDDFFVYSTVGALDFAYQGVHMQFNAMLRYPDHFVYGRTPQEGNFYLCTAPKVWHGDTMSPMFFYNALPVIFN